MGQWTVCLRADWYLIGGHSMASSGLEQILEMILRRSTALHTLLLLVAALCFSIGCHRDWDHAAAFERGLKCGMTVRDVNRLAADLGASEFRSPQLAGLDQTIPDYYVSKNERLISLWFDKDGRLVSYMSSLTSFEHEGEAEVVRVELCPPR